MSKSSGACGRDGADVIYHTIASEKWLPKVQNILLRLRERTADLHQSVESALPLARERLSREEYGRVLQGFHGYLSVWEPRIDSAAPPGLSDFVKDRARTVLLEADMKSLGIRPLQERAEQFLPAIPGPAALLGSMYVFEGSRLGGQMLTRHLSSSLGLDPDHGLSFFYGFGAETGRKWRAFCALLEERIHDAEADEAVLAARSTFQLFEQWMKTVLVAVEGK